MKVPWVDTIRRATGLVEHICEHGIGHPAYGSVDWLEKHGHKDMGVHGCDGCCQTPEWQLADAREGVRVSNDILISIQKKPCLANKYIV